MKITRNEVTVVSLRTQTNNTFMNFLCQVEFIETCKSIDNSTSKKLLLNKFPTEFIRAIRNIKNINTLIKIGNIDLIY